VRKINKFEVGIRGERLMLKLHFKYNFKPYLLLFTSPGYGFEFEQYRLAAGITITFR